MQKEFLNRFNVFEISLSLFVLVVLIFFSFGIFVRAPYTGLHIHPSNGKVVGIYVETDLIQLDDVIKKVGDVTFEAYLNDNRQPLFENAKNGDAVEILLNRNGQDLTVAWKMPGINNNELSKRINNIWWLAYIYWGIGVATQQFIKPKNASVRNIFIIAVYLTSVWVILGCISAWHIWEGSVLVRASSWLLLATYIHLHWIFPKPFQMNSKWLGYLLYGVCSLFALAEIFQLIHRGFYALAFGLAIAGSMVLLIIHWFRQKEKRREIGLLILTTFLILAPFISFSINGIDSRFAQFTFLALPLMPLTYFYTMARRQLGDMEGNVNHFISGYIFIVLVGTTLPFLLKPTMNPDLAKEIGIFLTIIITLGIILFSIYLYPKYQRFFEERVLNIKLPFNKLQESFSSRITTSKSIDDLLQLLEKEVFPSLYIRQYAFVKDANGTLNTLLEKNIPEKAMFIENGISPLLERSGKYISSFESPEDWIRLILPLQVGDSLIGFWLLGARGTDDFYSFEEIPILQSLANQTAIALSNLLQTERLKTMYQDEVNQNESERLHLSLRLHDKILYELGKLYVSLENQEKPPEFEEIYYNLKDQLRDIVVDLRPLMLSDGLKLALQGLADNFMQRTKDTVDITVDIESDETRYEENHIEEHIFHMVQEACNNAVNHGQAKVIKISGKLCFDEISLTIADDGIGFDMAKGIEVDTLHKHRHFGLAGIMKRAELIGAKINFFSQPQKGANLQITLKLI